MYFITAPPSRKLTFFKSPKLKNTEKIMTFFHVLAPEKEIHVFVNSFESGSVPSGFNILVDDKYIFV